MSIFGCLLVLIFNGEALWCLTKNHKIDKMFLYNKSMPKQTISHSIAPSATPSFEPLLLQIIKKNTTQRKKKKEKNRCYLKKD